jgi:hypothetical protein
MLLDERLMLYGRGSQTGYAGALGTPGAVTVKAVSASLAPQGPTSNTQAFAASVFVVVAADAGDLLGTNGYSMHQGPATAATSLSVTTGQAIQVTVGTDVAGALGYNYYCASVAGGPYVYSGRSGSNVGYITGQGIYGPEVASGGADQSANANNYDGLLTNTAASGGYVTRLNAPFSTTNPGSEFQTAFGSLYEQVKGDPEEIWLNGFDRLQLSNAIVNNAANSAYRVYIPNDTGMGGVKAGTVVQSLLNEVTGSEVPLTVHPWMPQFGAVTQQCVAA